MSGPTSYTSTPSNVAEQNAFDSNRIELSGGDPVKVISR